MNKKNETLITGFMCLYLWSYDDRLCVRDYNYHKSQIGN